MGCTSVPCRCSSIYNTTRFSGCHDALRNIYTDTSCDICKHVTCRLCYCIRCKIYSAISCDICLPCQMLHLQCMQNSSPDAASWQPKNLVLLQMLHLLGTDVTSAGRSGHLPCLWLQHLCFSSFFGGFWPGHCKLLAVHSFWYYLARGAF